MNLPSVLSAAAAIGALAAGVSVYQESRREAFSPRSDEAALRTTAGSLRHQRANADRGERPAVSGSGPVERERFDSLAAAIAQTAAGRDGGAGESFGESAAVLQQAVDAVPAEQLGEALRHLVSRSQTPAVEELTLRILQRWSEIDAAAAAGTLSLLSPAVRDEACRRIAAQWASQDLEGAMDWAAQRSEPDLRQAGQVAILRALTLIDPLQALTLASEIDLPAEEEDLLSHAASRWAASDAREAAAWAAHMEDPVLHDQVAASIATTWASEEPEEAARWAIATIANEEVLDRAVLGMFQRLAVRDAPAAESWLEQLPASSLKERLSAERIRMQDRHRMAGQEEHPWK